MNTVAQQAIDTVSRFLLGHPTGKALVAEAVAAEELEKVQRRQDLVTELKRIESEDLENLRESDRLLQPLRAEELRAKTAFEEAQKKTLVVEQRRRDVAYENGRQMDRLRAELDAMSDPAIDAFVAKARTEIKGVMSRIETVNGWLAGSVTWTNAQSVTRRADACHAALMEARTLVSEAPLTGPALTARLEQLWKALPAIEARPR